MELKQDAMEHPLHAVHQVDHIKSWPESAGRDASRHKNRSDRFEFILKPSSAPLQ
jgi:hypothetical protein